MGHWKPSTLGNDHAWDLLGELAQRSDTRWIQRAMQEGLRLPPDDAPPDELEAPRMLALAEAVAAGLGRPSPELLDTHARWCAAHADLLAEHVTLAARVLAPVLAGPYARGWSTEESRQQFQRSVQDLRDRLEAGRVLPLEPPEDRFRRALSALLTVRGWHADTPDRWSRSCVDGQERVCVRFRHRKERTAALVWLERTFPADTRRLSTMRVVPRPPPEDSPCLIVRPPQPLWDSLGDRGWARLHDNADPPGAHRESAVRRAAEETVVWIERDGETVLARFRGAALPLTLKTRSMEFLRRHSPANTLLAWLFIASRVAPEAVSRLVQERQRQLDRLSSTEHALPMMDALAKAREACEVRIDADFAPSNP